MKKFAVYFMLLGTAFALIFGMYFLTGCTPQKRLNYLLERHPYLKQTETIIVHDTIRDTIEVKTPGVEIPSTPLNLFELKDTVYIDTNQLHIKLWTNATMDTVFVEGKCDTVIVSVPLEIPVAIPVDVEKIQYRRPRDNLRWFAWGFMAAVTLIFALQFMRNRPAKNDPVK